MRCGRRCPTRACKGKRWADIVDILGEDVDTELGPVKVVLLDCAQDVGKVIDADAVVGQITVQVLEMGDPDSLYGVRAVGVPPPSPPPPPS